MGKNTLKLDVKGFSEYIEKLDRLGADLKPIVNKALEQAGERISKDTHNAVKKENFPAGGQYSKGDTEKSIIDAPKVEWNGAVAEIGVGFDYNKPGAGGFLITGTPKMKPDQELNRMYKGKKYISGVQNDMIGIFNSEIQSRLGGKSG